MRLLTLSVWVGKRIRRAKVEKTHGPEIKTSKRGRGGKKKKKGKGGEKKKGKKQLLATSQLMLSQSLSNGE